MREEGIRVWGSGGLGEGGRGGSGSASSEPGRARSGGGASPPSPGGPDPNSLISVSTDEDLDNLVYENHRVAATSSGDGSSRTSRIRLFLFPAKPESSSSLGSLLDDSSKSETWFVDALNSAI